MTTRELGAMVLGAATAQIVFYFEKRRAVKRARSAGWVEHFLEEAARDRAKRNSNGQFKKKI